MHLLLTNVKIFTQNEAFLVENVKQEFLINHIQLLNNANKPITMQKIHAFRHKDMKKNERSMVVGAREVGLSISEAADLLRVPSHSYL